MPTDKLPEGAMPKTAAYRMITDELALDGKPMLKYANPDIHRYTALTVPALRASAQRTW